MVPITDNDLLGFAPFFLYGIAQIWYRNKHSRFQSWAECAGAFRRRFCDPDLQFSLREEILRRTQGLDEPIFDYLTCIRALSERVKPRMPETEQLDLAHRNMLPQLQVGILRADAHTFESLERSRRELRGATALPSIISLRRRLKDHFFRS